MATTSYTRLDDYLYRVMHTVEDAIGVIDRIAQEALHDDQADGSWEAYLRINSLTNGLRPVVHAWYDEHIIGRATAAYAAQGDE